MIPRTRTSIAPPRCARRRSLTALLLCLLAAAACAEAERAARREAAPDRTSGTDADGALASRAARLESLLTALAADSMEGRRACTAGAHRAARFLAERLEASGVEAAGDDGYFQSVPLARVPDGPGAYGVSERLVLPSASVDFDTLPPDRILTSEVNVVGILRGADPAVANEAVIIGAHFDHVGIGPAVNVPGEGLDSIYNGADDDGSGTVAVLEIARSLAGGEPPRRTIIFLLSTAEEMGLLGTRWYTENPVVPLDRTVANLQIEMIGRPDSLAGGPGRGWLTGYERTTMGSQLARAGSPIVPDPRPEQNFFFRSDNIAFARLGIPAHTLSSYGMHADYHQPSDEVDAVDFDHMAILVEAAVDAVRVLADGPRPEWVEGGREGLPGG